MIESTVSQRRELDSERQTKETEDQRRAREVRDHIQPRLSFALLIDYTGRRYPSQSARQFNPKYQPS